MQYKYNVLNYDLTNGLNEEVQVQGGFVYIKDATDLTVKVAIRPDSKTNDLIYLKKQFGVIVDFKKLYITADAQPGKSVEIVIANSYDTFRIFEQAQVQDINTIGSITNPVTIQNPTIADILKIGGTTQTGWDLQRLQKNLDAEYGTQITKSGYAYSDTGGTTLILHTVSAGKTLLLENVGLSAIIRSGAYGETKIYVRDTSDILVYELIRLSSYSTNTLSQDKSVNIIIPSGYDIVLSTDATYMVGAGFIKGREF